MRAIVPLALCLPLVACFAACGWEEYKDIKEPFVLAAESDNPVTLSVEQLQNGQDQYILYCRACHGAKGDGRGPAGIGLHPPPRNFTAENLAFKFGGVEAGELPPDSELIRIVKGGLDGTAMLPWDLPDSALIDILAYIKTFNPVWNEDEPGELLEITEDPWKGRKKDAILQGSKVYHGKAQCLQCHPSYETQEQVYNYSKELGSAITSFRPNMFLPEAKYSQAFKVKLLPPDFGRNPIRAGSTPRDIFRTVAGGIGGTAMPMWKGSLVDSDIWALGYFVASIAEMKDKPAYRAMMKRLRAAPAFTAPTEPDEGEGAVEGEEEGKDKGDAP